MCHGDHRVLMNDYRLTLFIPSEFENTDDRISIHTGYPQIFQTSPWDPDHTGIPAVQKPALHDDRITTAPAD